MKGGKGKGERREGREKGKKPGTDCFVTAKQYVPSSIPSLQSRDASRLPNVPVKCS